MAEIRFNSCPNSLFDVRCNEKGTVEDRDRLVAQGRLMMYEANGRETARIRKNSASFESRLPNGTDYHTASEKYKEKLLVYCATVAKRAIGEPAPANYDEFLAMQRDFYEDKQFLRVLAGIARDTVRPMLPYVLSNAIGELGQMIEVPFGQTEEITVLSNDVILFSDSSNGAIKSVPEQDLYNYTITLNPEMKAAKVSIKWRQLIANNADIGLWYNSLAAGMYSKIMAMWSAALANAASGTFFIPSYLKKTTYNTDNLIALAKGVSEANHIAKDQLMIYGDWLALSHVLPSGTSQDAALTYGLGSEFNSNGFLGTVLGIPAFMWQNVIVPGTQNTTGTEVLPNNTIYVAARGGRGNAPLYVGIERGTTLTLEIEPTRTADQSLDITMATAIDVKAIFGSKVGVITNV